ncbi:MAG: ribulose-phosphate 3-epimerase [Bacteroidales bacterium]|nr:ribulose-phosphate 3-epimerase [Bacteroidales bacterium]
MVQIAPSMLAADFLHLEKDVELVNRYADIFHLDIMDGTFVPNISYGFPIVEAIAKQAEKPLDAHLMIVHPEKYVDRFAKVGVDMLSFHLNAVENAGQVLAQIRAAGMKPGLAINPDIPVSRLFPYLDQCDYIVLMSVFAGFGGQKFIEATYDRLAAVKDEVRRQGVDCLIQVDGGVSAVNAAKLVENGADILVAGSAVFKAADPAEVISAMRI